MFFLQRTTTSNTRARISLSLCVNCEKSYDTSKLLVSFQDPSRTHPVGNQFFFLQGVWIKGGVWKVWRLYLYGWKELTLWVSSVQNLVDFHLGHVVVQVTG